MTAAANQNRRPLLIVGGAGFVGSNVAERVLRRGERVRVLDNLARPGSSENLRDLERRYGEDLEVIRGDVREPSDLRRALAGTSAAVHCAAQSAATTSLSEPSDDFEVNARGTLNLLEALRAEPRPLVYTSTNEVYGELSDLGLVARGDRYIRDDPAHPRGIDERRPLALCGPDSCSKGAADQYVLHYANRYGVPATVFRMSCIYGPRQFGDEDQGWVAHFLLSALSRRPITIYGDGRQVRDLLFVGDLTDAVFLALANIDLASGRAFNIGGGPERSASPREMVSLLGEILGTEPEVDYADWRPGDPRYYVSDTSAFQRITGWEPRVDIRDGLSRVRDWLQRSLGAAGLAAATAAPRAARIPAGAAATHPRSRQPRSIAHEPPDE